MINLRNPYDKPMGFDFYADIMRQTRPGEAIKVYYRFLFEERLKKGKIAEYTRKLNHVENSSLSEKNNLIERRQTYKDKMLEIQRLKKGIESKKNLAVLDNFMKVSNHLSTTKRQKRVVVETDEKKISEEEKLSKTFEVLQEKQKTFLTSLDDFETSSIIFSSKRDSVINSFDRKINTKPKTPKLPIKVSKKKVASIESHLPKLALKTEKRSKIPETKSKLQLIELPLDYGEFVFPIIPAKQKTQA